MSETKIIDLVYLSDTMPVLPDRCIPRDNYIDAIEQTLKGKSVFFLDAEEGVGVTTTLALFAVHHRFNCISYFNNGMVKQLLDPAFIEQSLIRQLYFFIYNDVLSDEEVSSIDLKGLYVKIGRKLREQDKPLYFVFDGFDDIPPQSRDNILNLMGSLPWDKGKFIFSGKYEKLKDYLPKKIKYAPDQVLQKFSRLEVLSFLKEIQSDLTTDDYEALCKISGCVGAQLSEMLSFYDKHHSFAPLLQLEDADSNDLFAYHFNIVEKAKNAEDAMKVLAVVAFICMRLTKSDIRFILNMEESRFNDAFSTCDNYLVCRNNFVTFNTECNQRYVQNRLEKLKHEIELLFIQQFKESSDNPEVYSYLPVLLKSMNDKKGLVDYLNSEVVLKNIKCQQSQAALNEQCELGFTSIDVADSSQTASMFRFALNKSSSREIERNELWDNQIEALLEVGYFEKAYGLAFSVYLKEERLKALLLIARKKERIPSHVMDEVRSNITSLVDEIDFEHIPDKSMELAKLMFPYDYKIAVDIIERVAKVSKNRLSIDKLYTLLSMTSGQEKEKDNGDKFDILTAKIENDELKMMTRAVRSIFNKTNVDDILAELKGLPSILQGLLLLQYWIPEHSSIEGIGKLVIYAIQSVISISNIERPKVTLINDFCTALPNMSSAEIDQVVVMIDSFQSLLLTPSEEYVRLELKVIEALFTFNIDRACERLQNLYLKIDDFTNKSTAIACKSIILGRYDSLGHKQQLEDALMPSFKLQREIEDEIKELFTKTAYHLKIVEEPLCSLVVNYRTSIYAIIDSINTLERRSRSYMIAADAYIHQVKVEEWDWDYLTSLIDKITYDKDDRSQLIYSLTKEIVQAKNINDDFLNKIKQHHRLFYEVEHAFAKSSVLSDLYVLFKKTAPNDTFVTSISNELSSCWEKVDLPWVKVDLGYLIAKTIACVSVDEAKEWIEKVSSNQQSSILASSSSVSTFQESVDLYNRSLGILIRSDLVDDKIINEYSSILDEFESKGEEIISWSKTALYFYLAGKTKKFEEIYTKHIAKSLDNYSDYYRKYILYHSTPAFYFGSKSFFYTILEGLDDQFKNLCISRVAKFIFIKYVEINDAETYKGAYELGSKDCEDLIDLLNHCVDDSTFFGIFDSLCQSLNKSSKGVSKDQRQHFINQMSALVDDKLPMEGGIRHNGYKIACSISLSKLQNSTQNQSLLENWENQINTVDNIADQAFLYVYAAHYTQKTDKRQYFINKASEIVKGIPSTFDQSSRMDYCIDECRDTTKGLTKDMIGQFMEIVCSDKNGKIADVKRAYDCIYDYNPSMADVFLERIDTDPARSYYKAQLTRHSERTKRIALAKDNHSDITKLTSYEQKIFFSNEIANQISQKSTIYDVSDTLNILSIIYGNPITEVRDALSYFLENVFRKNMLSKNLGNLMIGIHDAILFNLKIVLALSSGTRDKLARIGYAIGEERTLNSPSFVRAGEKDKAIKYIEDWYTKYPYDDLFIIDAYFAPDDFYLLKRLMNVNNNLSITIITHRNNVVELEDYQEGWNKVSSDLTGSVNIHTISYESNRSLGPLHDRWWISINEDEDLREGIRLNSISGLGNKDGDISRIEEDKIKDIELLAMNYALGKKKKAGDEVLRYDNYEIKKQ